MLMEVKSRKDGMQHIALTVEILWQIWKARNEVEFEEKHKHPMAVITKAVKEWEEFQQAQRIEQQLSISETETAEVQDEMVGENDNIRTISIAVGQHTEGQNMGIGITVQNTQSQICAAWALKERSTGSVTLDHFLALQLTLCKIMAQGWQYIKILLSCSQVLRLIKCQASRDMCIAGHLEDIRHISSLFRRCSFDSLPVEGNSISKRLSKLAMHFHFDEEILDLLCLSTLL
ncbi:uncharacterized protein LOC113780156 [Coffea eugenioides]|uniref:uncharacterized protein LOC113780156 n=1 Tax=Coffea eugenioides TaxID=49369 RepID=UPI000F60DEA1|nr:uncharacterized protein LOC113780156 [Coffea eugenioides]